MYGLQNLKVGGNDLINGYANETLLHGNKVHINGYANDGFGIWKYGGVSFGGDMDINTGILKEVSINGYANDDFGKIGA